MDSNTQTFILGLAGIIATLISSGLGLYYTARARTSALRATLYGKQVELMMEIMRIIGRIRIYVTITIDPENDDFRRQAEDDLRVKISELSQLEDISTAILPVELYTEVKSFSNLVTDYLTAYGSNKKMNKILEKLGSQATKIGLLARVYLGIDELSVESAKLFTKKKEIIEISEMKPEEIVRTAKKKIDASHGC